ncbi:hypothetical protein GYMLUDRAFT_1028757 [Collybiopsis luxurians FD-317 M1]|uniref:Short-chain dehydrogenase/reductase n=1 Tax=Collybiopsis luxurians FD-317 M1 TaxID=944289 RepID=A0A0D0C3Y4_9AGAR|nr:hypothetical protein GYMLUDRAFT_1028757 [Collybiopsis luxurians FD-317 M1]
MASALSLIKSHHRATYPAISPTKPSLRQAGKTVLITGGGGGLGFNIARSFAKASASRIIIVGRRGGFLDEAVMKLRGEFKVGTEFMARQTDIGDDASVTALWDFLQSQKIVVHVLVLNAAQITPSGTDTLSMNKEELMTAFGVNVGGNFYMSAKFVQQPLRHARQQLNLINISTSGIHMDDTPFYNPYASSKAAFAALIGRIANERSVEDVQIISFHPGILYSEGVSKTYDPDAFKWDEMNLPADFSVWAASPEASWLHGRFVWAHWDVDELKANPDVLKRLEDEESFLKVSVQGLTSPSYTLFQDKCR